MRPELPETFTVLLLRNAEAPFLPAFGTGVMLILKLLLPLVLNRVAAEAPGQGTMLTPLPVNGVA